MSTDNVASGRKDVGGHKGEVVKATEFNHVEDELIAAQVLQRLERIERALSSMENRFGSRLDEIENQLAVIASRSGSGRPGKKVVVEKVPPRNVLIAMMQKGWVSETDLIAKTKELGSEWQTIGVRSLVTKLGGLGIAVEEEERSGVRHYRIPK